MKYSQKTQDLIDRMCRNVERKDFILDKKLSEELVMKTYDLFNLERPKNVKWFKDLTDKEFATIASSAWSAWSARLASSARSARLASSASSARSAWLAWLAWSASSAWLASSARLAWSASSAWSAWSARSAWSALDYDFDWYIYSFELNLSNNKDINENDIKYLEYCELLMQAKEAGLGYRIEFEDTLYLVPTPLVKINSLNQFHCENGPAIRWKGGQEIYLLNGVKFEKELFNKVISRDLSFADRLKIVDIDQRTQAINPKFCDIEYFIKEAKGELLDEVNKLDIEANPVNYKLYKFPKGNIFTQDAYYCYFDCPSTRKKHLEGVEVSKTVAEAMSWAEEISEEDWKLRIPLLHEN